MWNATLARGAHRAHAAAIKPGAKTTVLDVNDNRLEKLPAEIGTLEALEELLVYKNQLKELPNGGWRAEEPEDAERLQ